MATATKVALSRSAQVDRECAGKIASAATAEWHELNAICQQPWMLKQQQLRLHEQQPQSHESGDITLLSNARCAILLLLRRENDRILQIAMTAKQVIHTAIIVMKQCRERNYKRLEQEWNLKLLEQHVAK